MRSKNKHNLFEVGVDLHKQNMDDVCTMMPGYSDGYNCTTYGWYKLDRMTQTVANKLHLQ